MALSAGGPAAAATLRAEPALLDACLEEFQAARLPGGIGRLRIAVEPRHASWWTEEVRQILARDAGMRVTRTPPVGSVPLTAAMPTW